MIAESVTQLRSVSRPVRRGSASINLEVSNHGRYETGSIAAAAMPGDASEASRHLLELLDRTDKLMNEVHTVLRRISVELERSGISPSTSHDSRRAPAGRELDSLSPREEEVVRLLLEGNRVSTIARSLFISQHTVRNHLQSVYRKVGVSSQAELIEKLKFAARPSPCLGREEILEFSGS